MCRFESVFDIGLPETNAVDTRPKPTVKAKNTVSRLSRNQDIVLKLSVTEWIKVK